MTLFSAIFFISPSKHMFWVLIEAQQWDTSNKYHNMSSASVAQLDARPTGDQEVVGSTPTKVGNILSWR